MRKDCVTVNSDGTYTVKGGGWFWCKIKKTPQGLAIIESAPEMEQKKASRLFRQEAKATIEKHFLSDV